MARRVAINGTPIPPGGAVWWSKSWITVTVIHGVTDAVAGASTAAVTFRRRHVHTLLIHTHLRTRHTFVTLALIKGCNHRIVLFIFSDKQTT